MQRDKHECSLHGKARFAYVGAEALKLDVCWKIGTAMSMHAVQVHVVDSTCERDLLWVGEHTARGYADE